MSLKRLVKQTGATVLDATGRLAAHQRSQRERDDRFGDAVVLMYHRVVQDWERDMRGLQAGMAVTTADFEQQMKLLKSERTVVPLQQIIDSVATGQPLPERAAAITFDDGWRDNYTNALPILQKYDLPACLFVTTDYIDSEKLFWFHALGLLIDYNAENALERLRSMFEAQETTTSSSARFDSLDSAIESVKLLPPHVLDDIAAELAADMDIDLQSLAGGRSMLTWDEVASMHNADVEIGSHGCSHRIMTGLSSSELEDELTRSRDIIQQRLGKPPSLLAYPNGNCSEAVVAAAEATGYSGAVSTSGCENHPDQPHPFMIRRINIHHGTTAGISGSFYTALWRLALSGYPTTGYRI